MKRLTYFLLLIVLAITGCAGNQMAMQQPPPSLLDAKTITLINDAVFEVVVLKPTKDSLTYEKPLPFDLIPYTIRTDKYFSIGTAFAIGPEQFISAAHVMNLGLESQFKEVYIRDKEGKVYAIHKIVKYSDHRDFVVFTLKEKTAKHFLPVNGAPQINERVYAVGNALGQGMVIRDGLYTSNTAEEEAGEWKWMRFSAAASPGNSGGPLLDKNGNVIGVILGKSQNENLNFALPISEVQKAKPNAAVVHQKMKYVLDNTDMTKIGTLEKEFPLPKSYDELNKELMKSMNQYSAKLLKDIFSENKENIFPRGKGSTKLLHSTIGAVFPHLIMKGDDGNWDAFYPKETQTAELERNGYLSYGGMGASLYMYIQKPDDVPLEKFYGDSKLFMDLALKGISLYRTIGSEKIEMTSLGKAKEDTIFVDSYGRKWMVRTWLLEFDDSKLVTFSLPVPGGCITMLRLGQTGVVNNGHIPDLKVLADFIYVSYTGTLKQWKEFLKQKEMLPSLFSTLTLSSEYGKVLDFKSKRVSFSYTPNVLEISEKSQLQLYLAYFENSGKVVWDVSGIYVGEDKSSDTGFVISRNMKPHKDLKDTYHTKWENIVQRKFPYNSSVYYEDKLTSIGTVFTKNAQTVKKEESVPVLYTVWYGKEGKSEQKEMEMKLDSFMQKMAVYEGGQTSQ